MLLERLNRALRAYPPLLVYTVGAIDAAIVLALAYWVLA